MGVHDRAYMRGRGTASISYGTSWTLRSVILLVVVFVAAEGAKGWFGWRGEESLLLSRESLLDGRWWTIVTSALFHDGAFHLFFNALGLWYFGKLVEETLGSARFVAFFWLAAVVSHVPFLAVEFARQGDVETIGASGIVMAMLVFAAFRYPGMPFSFWGLPLVLWQLAVLYAGVDVYGLVTNGGGVDHWTHAGGAAFGFLVHRFGLVPSLRLPRWRRAHRADAAREPGPFAQGNARADIDRLLDKIAADGIASLTDEERAFLKENSGRYR